jgi:catechol 2,3-dioxygenase-like lactoylglutathione lyase family enzyme
MKENEHEIALEFLDHVAIRVKDMEVSAKWYKEVLGLKRYQLPEWGDSPIFLLSGKTGIALFPADAGDPELDLNSRNVKIDHFAFNVTRENFEKAIKRYIDLNLDFNIQDHFYFDSVYSFDPDGHKVELTTIKVDEDTFYK